MYILVFLERTMIDTNYPIEALDYLLDEKCLSERYYPLIEYKNQLITKSRKLGCKNKNDIAKLSNSDFLKFGLQDEKMIKLLRRFLTIYDPNPQKFKEIEKLNLEAKQYRAFKELYYLPGIKQTRANLYYCSGYKTIKAIAKANVEDILKNTALAISTNKLSCIVPLAKEVKTHIAVAKAFTQKSNIK